MSRLIGKKFSVNTVNGSGIFDIREAADYKRRGTWPINNPDPFFNYTALLLKGDDALAGGQNNTFIAQSKAAADSPGGYSVFFDGSGDYLVPTSSSIVDFGTGDFTIEMFVNLSALGSTRVLLDGRSAASDNRILLLIGTDNKLYFGTVVSGSVVNFVTSTSVFSVGQWVHVAVTRSGTSLRLFFNGTLESSATNSTNFASGTDRPTIGATGFIVGNDVLFGYISNLRIVKGTAVYTSNFTVPTAPLTAISGTSLLACHAATIVDGSTNNFTITQNGNVRIASPQDSGYTITRAGNTTQGTFSPYSSFWSNYFDGGTTTYLSIPASSQLDIGTNQFTIEAWVFLNRYETSGGGLAGRWKSSGNRSYLFYVTSAGALIFAYNSDFGVSGGTMPLNTWTHVAASRDSNNVLRVFINGVIVGSATVTASIGQGTAEFVIGTNQEAAVNNIANWTTNGYISNVRLLVGTAAYTSNFTVPTSPLTAVTNTRLLSSNLNRFADSSTNNFTVTRVGNVSVQEFSPFLPSGSYDPTLTAGSAYFDGTGDWVTTPNISAFDLSSSSTNFTIEAWVYNTGGGQFRGIFGARQNAQTQGWCIYIHQNNTLYMGSVIVGNAYADRQMNTTIIPPNAWAHVALVKTASGYTAYVNGVGGTLLALTGGLDYQSAQPVIVGALGSQGEYPFIGYIASARIVKGTAVYTSNFSPPTAPLTNITNTSLLLNFTNASIIDSTTGSNIETIGNAQVSTAVKKYGTGSMVFDGNGDILFSSSLLYSLGSRNFTIEGWFYFNDGSANALRVMWVNYTTWTAQSIYFGKHTNNTGRVTFWVNNFSASAALLVDPNFPPTATWVHYAVVRNGNTFTLYRDGVSVASATYTGVATTNTLSYVGGEVSSATNSFNGYIDDFRITNGIARYTANFVPPIPLPSR